MAACKCKPYGKARGMCAIPRRFQPGDLVEKLCPFTRQWRGPYVVRREWKRKGWDREHMVEVLTPGRRIGGGWRASEVRPLRASTPWTTA